MITTTATWDELVAAGLCDCGLPLADHPALPLVSPWGGWRSRGREGGPGQAGGRRSATVQPTVYRRRHRGQKISLTTVGRTA